MVTYGGWLTDVGSYIGRTSRGILDTAGKAINVLSTRGGADSPQDVFVPEERQDTTPLLLIGGAALAALLILRKK